MMTILNKQKKVAMMKILSCACLIIWLSAHTFTAMAAPQDSMPNNQGRSHHLNKEERRGGDREGRERFSQRHQAMINELPRVRERGHWKTGAPIPQNYLDTEHQVDYTQYPKLSEPSRYQQWIKVDDRFILINVITNTVLKVTPE